MQSRPSEASQHHQTQFSLVQSNTSAQHGPQDLCRPIPSSSSQGDAVEDAVQLPKETDSVSVSSGDSTRGRHVQQRRLSRPGGSPLKRSPGSRIEQYEKLQSPSPKRGESVVFQVIPSSDDGDTQHWSIDQFPNEVLTCILSYLPASSLSTMSLVSTRFYHLVTSPHAWRMALGRYYSAQIGPPLRQFHESSDPTAMAKIDSGPQFFTRLTALASWRSEYVLRTRLLRSLRRGIPLQDQSSGRSTSARLTNARKGVAVVTYRSNLDYPVSNLHSTFGLESSQRVPTFMHGASLAGDVTISDPVSGVGSNKWALEPFSLQTDYFHTEYPDHSMWGLSDAPLVGLPNSLDISTVYGQLYAEGLPNGCLRFGPTVGEKTKYLAGGRPIDFGGDFAGADALPRSPCCAWIAKSDKIVKASGGLIGLMSGDSNGIVSAYSLGSSAVLDHPFRQGEMTARWVLSPGVPIIALHVDDHLSTQRLAEGRIWALALNALGEIFYLDKLPVRAERLGGQLSSAEEDRLAWATGRSVRWELIELTRRTPRADPFKTTSIDATYSPRSPADAMGLTPSQIEAEWQKIFEFLSYSPKHFRAICDGWDMRRKLIVDFAGDDGDEPAEGIFLLTCGVERGPPASLTRFTPLSVRIPGPGPHATRRVEWLRFGYSFGEVQDVEITAYASDHSNFAVTTASEDPTLRELRRPKPGRQFQPPHEAGHALSESSYIPGHRARVMAVGTNTGVVLLWNMRATSKTASGAADATLPMRMLSTESSRITCLALTSLYLVHGDNNGLVQAWDPLSDSPHPLRTLNSRFSNRMRRQLIHAAPSADAGEEYHTAGAVVLDPNPTVLRGIVALGTNLRYWSYSSSAVDQHRGSKRKSRRRSDRRSNSLIKDQRFNHTNRGVLKDYITDEKQQLELDRELRRQEAERVSGRFGLDLLGPGASEEEMVAYATILSEESYASDEMRRQGSGDDAMSLSSTSTDSTSLDCAPRSASSALDADTATAIRLSLVETTPELHPEPNSAPLASSSTSYQKPSAAQDSAQQVFSGALTAQHHCDNPSAISEEHERLGHAARDSDATHDDDCSCEERGGKVSITTTGEGTPYPVDQDHSYDHDLDLALRLSLAAQPNDNPGTVSTDLETDFPALASPARSPSSSAGTPTWVRTMRTEDKGKGKGKGKSDREP